MEIGGKDVTPLVNSFSGTYAASGGSSTMEIEVQRGSLSRVQGQMCRLFVGYGDPDSYVEYFTGKIEEPKSNPFSRTDTATVYGPYAEMGEPASMMEDVDYSGWTVEQVMLDLGERSNQNPRFLEVRGGRVEVIDQDIVAAETAPYEVASSITDAMNFVLSDRPKYRRLVMPRPRPGSTGRAKATYTPDDVQSEEDFTIEPLNAVLYAKVIVMRRADDGSYPVWREAAVANRGVLLKPPPNHVFWVTDYPGTNAQAGDKAAQEAMWLSRVAWSWHLQDIALNPDLLLYDSVYLEREAEGVHETYVALLEDDITFGGDNSGSLTMSVGGTAILIDSRPVEKTYKPKATTGIFRLSPPPEPEPILWSSSLKWDELGDLTWDEA
ncbi:hypothetical protein [Rubrobacter calidifluminis]|uniref:hypothetical protein n=1 Tax=Rubrobacter calidifluminis TaxID=1392640 RepID=UPI00235F238B|nr:hypothetical protein [Rubrobacter calidifluminis]